MAPNHRLNAVAFISPLNHPILIRTFAKNEDTMKAHYIAHTSLDVIEERGKHSCLTLRFGLVNHLLALEAQTNSKSVDCYLGLLYSMEDVAIYGYITPLKVKIVVALALSDSVVRDVEVISVGLLTLENTNHLESIIINEIGIDIQSTPYGILRFHFQPISKTSRCQ